jgi:hypothetical protein
MPKDHWRIQRSITQHKQRASKTKRHQNKLLGIPTSYLSWTWKCIFKVQSTFINSMLLDSNLGRTRIASGRCSTSNGPRRTRLLSLSSSLLDWFYQPVCLQWKQSPFSSLSRQTQQYAITIGYICWLKLRFDALLGISESIIHWQLRRSVPSEKWMLLDFNVSIISPLSWTYRSIPAVFWNFIMGVGIRQHLRLWTRSQSKWMGNSMGVTHRSPWGACLSCTLVSPWCV